MADNSNYGDGIKRAFKIIAKEEKKFLTKAEKESKDRIRKFRKEASRKASVANKRLQRLEGNKLTDSPAYRSLTDGSGKRPRFSIRGKSYNEVQKEVAKMNKFLENTTSTVRGANRVLKTIAKNTGLKYKNLTELQQKASTFFDLASKIEQYLRTVEDIASAIGYQKIWEQINTYVEKSKIDLSNSQKSVEQMTNDIVQAMDIYEAESHQEFDLGFGTLNTWYKLDKD